MRADDPVLGTTEPGDLWLYATDGWLQWPGRAELTAPVPEAGLAFRADDTCWDHGCTLVIAGLRARRPQRPRGRREPSPARDADGGLECPSRPTGPAPTCGSPSRTSGAPLDLRLTGLSLVLAPPPKGPT